MADATELAGGDETPTPSWDVTQYQTWPQLDEVVADLTHNGGAWADLTHNAAAERWYDLGAKVGTAVTKLGEVNAAFQAEYNNLKSSGWEGAAADSFFEFANELFKHSDSVHETASSRGFAATTDDIGHDIQGFAQMWWDLVRKAHDAEATVAQAYDLAVNTGNDSAETLEVIKNEVQGKYNEIEVKLYEQLRELLSGLRNRYQMRGNSFPALDVRKLVKHGTESGGASNSDQSAQQLDPTQRSEPATQSLDPTERSVPATESLDPTQRLAGSAQDYQGVDPSNQPGAGTMTNDPAQAGTPLGQDMAVPAGTTPASDAGLADSGVMPGSTGSGSSGTSGNDQATQAARDAANKAINDLGAAASDPGASGGVMPTGSSGTGSSGTGSSGGQPGSSGGSGDGSGSSGSSGYDQAMEDARKAANDAIDGLSGGSGESGLPSTESSGPGEDSGAGSDQEDAAQRQQALDDARTAANDALDKLDGGEGSSSLADFLSGSDGDADPATAKALQDAKDTIGSAIENMPGYNDDNAYGHALHEARDAAQRAIEGLPGFPSDTGTSGPSVGLAGLESGGHGGLGGHGGGLPGGGGHGGGIPGPSTLDGGPGQGAGSAHLDTDVAAKSGLAVPAGSGAMPGAPMSQSPMAAANAGMPMGGMPMGGGGMGGMGGGAGDQQKPRDPVTWIQADDGAWNDESDGDEAPPVLGRRGGSGG